MLLTFSWVYGTCYLCPRLLHGGERGGGLVDRIGVVFRVKHGTRRLKVSDLASLPRSVVCDASLYQAFLSIPIFV